LHRTMTKVCKSDGEGTFAGTRGNGEVAPIPVVRITAAEPSISIVSRRYEGPGQRLGSA
jgi:hypothetical protein